jgi:hypothetical protein
LLHWNSKEKHGNAMSYTQWQREFAYIYTRRQKKRVKEHKDDDDDAKKKKRIEWKKEIIII